MGDLGNIIVDKTGKVDCVIKAKKVKLRGKYSVIGRSIVIHQKEDDLGNGNDEGEPKDRERGKTYCLWNNWSLLIVFDFDLYLLTIVHL